MDQIEIMQIMFYAQWLTHAGCSINNDYYSHTYITLATVAEIASQWQDGGQWSFTAVMIITYLSFSQTSINEKWY